MKRYRTRYRDRVSTRTVYVDAPRNVYIPGQTVYRTVPVPGKPGRVVRYFKRRPAPSTARFRASPRNLMFKARRRSKRAYTRFLFNKAAGGGGGRSRMRRFLCGR